MTISGGDLLGHEQRCGRIVAAAHHGRRAFDLRQVGPAVDAHRGELLLALVDLDAGPGAHRHHLIDQRLVGQPAGRDDPPGLEVLSASGCFEGTLVGKDQLEADVRWLPKPYRKQELARKIEEVLSMRFERTWSGARGCATNGDA
jgi:hypothetical protein